MELLSVEGNTQRLDGGAMFGNVPKALWARWCSPDEQNRIQLSCRALLVKEDTGRAVLLEAGIGAFFAPKLRERFGVASHRHELIESLRAVGLGPDDIDVIVLSHLHFDHAGGLLTPYAEAQAPALAFPNAKYVIGKRAWERAEAPHPRDRASFIPELLPLLRETGNVELVDGATSQTLGDGYSFRQSDGHTPGLLLTTVQTPAGPVTFAADLIPGIPWVHLPVTMGYDRYPELLIDEKRQLLTQLADDGGFLFFTHDPEVAACAVERDDGHKFVPTGSVSSEAFSLDALR